MNNISGKIIDVVNQRIYSGSISISDGKITEINEQEVSENHYILPGFVDAHIHVESSMLTPAEFGRMAVVHGTVATISDPHEIGNVLGLEGIEYMISNSEQTPLKIYFGASPCVPATQFETAGATITPSDIRTLFEKHHLKYLSEMMNYPGVLNQDPDVMKKIEIAKELDKPIDGHAPGLRGDEAKAYIQAGISTDHECFTYEEALEKIQNGMKIIIREGSAAKNFNALHPLISQYPSQVMFCSDDKHPNDLVHGHINSLAQRSIELGYELMDVLRAACVNPVNHYGLNVGLLQKGDPADFIVVDNLKDFKVKATYIDGNIIASNGSSLLKYHAPKIVNHFDCSRKQVEDFKIVSKGPHIHVIEALPGELITNALILPAKIENGCYVADPENDLLKLAVVNRYQDSHASVAFIKGLGLKTGAIASSVAHDSHNIVSAGADDSSLCQAVNAVIENKGGIALSENGKVHILPLPIAGLMSDEDGWECARKYQEIKEKSKALGSTLPDPFMTLSFMALLVIPSIKLSDQGLFDAESFKFVSLTADKLQPIDS